MSGFIFLETTELSLNEADGQIFVPVVRTGDLSEAVTVEYGITGLDATPGSDFVESRAFVTIPAGEDRATISVEILDDNLAETTETVVVSIINIDSGSLQAPRTARIDILDDENPVTPPQSPPLSSVYDVSQETVLSELLLPIDLEFVPDFPDAPVGSQYAFVAEKGGLIKVVDTASGTVLSDFIDLTDVVNNDADRGLLDIAIDPDFANNPYIYAFYVVDPPETIGETGRDGPDGSGNRFAHVVRFTADAENGYLTVVEGSEKILVGAAGQSLSDISGNGNVDSTSDINLQESGIDPDTGAYIDDYLKVDSRSHAGGALAFGPDGALYISTGDGTSYNFADPRSASVQDINSLSGKILRVDPETGLGLADNPFADQAQSLSSNAAKVYQLGLRNPFSMTFDDNGNLLITETGWNSFEEINAGGPGANFGWPWYEGGDNGTLVRAPGYRNFDEADAFYDAVASGEIEVTAPFRGFSHRSSDPGYQVQSITGSGVVYTGDKYPAVFQNDYFFSDFSQGEIFTVDVNDRRDVSFLYESSSGRAPVHFEQAPDGFVYYVDIVTGQIGRLLITGGPADELAPLAFDDFGQTSPSDALPVISVLANDVDPDGESETLIVSAVGGSAANLDAEVVGSNGGTFVISENGNAVFDPNGDFATLAPGTSTTTSVEYVTRDVDGREDTALYTVTVTAPNDPSGALIRINARGETGEENVALLIDDEIVATFEAVSADGETLTYQSSEAQIDPTRVKVAFTNDFYEPEQGIDRNLVVESIEIRDKTFVTADASVFSNGTWLPEDGITPGFGRGNILHTTGFFEYSTPIADRSTITIEASGNTGFETMELLIDGVVVETFENIAQAGAAYIHNADSEVTADQVRIQFTNDFFDPETGQDFDLIVDRIVIDGEAFETEADTTYSTGTWLEEDGIQPGFGRGETLSTNGYFQYDAMAGGGSRLEIFAAGYEGTEIMELRIDNALVATFENISTDGDVFVFDSTRILTANQVQIAFVNDTYDPANGIDSNLIIDKIAIDGVSYETEASTVLSTATWLPEDGIQPGLGRGDTLHANGFFQYGVQDPDADIIL